MGYTRGDGYARLDALMYVVEGLLQWDTSMTFFKKKALQVQPDPVKILKIDLDSHGILPFLSYRSQ